VKGLRERLAKVHVSSASSLLKLGFEIFCEPKAGIFLWARHPALPDSAELAYKAAEQDILLGPGHLFSPELKTSAWLRFNVIFCDEPALFEFLERSTR
jgi:DNA-binding transcriptional MocR family regulator